MSTRAVYTFIDERHPTGIHVYKHSDGYPSGAFDAIGMAFPFAWVLPRFEADEFAAAFVCGNKLPHWVESSFVNFIEDAYKTQPIPADPKDPFAIFKADIITKIMTVKVEPWALNSHVGRGGGVRLLNTADLETAMNGDEEYRYEIYEKNGEVWVRGFELYSEEKVIFDTPFRLRQDVIDRINKEEDVS